MSDPKQTGHHAPVGRVDILMRVKKMLRSRQRSMLGVPEIAGLAGSAIMLLAVVFGYLYFLTPARSRLVSLTAERERLQKTLRESTAGVAASQDQQTTIEQINQSLIDFENKRLRDRNEGRMALYDELNTLMRSNKLRNTSGPTYTALEALGTGAQAKPTGTRPANPKLQSVFPGIGVSVTVEGQYQSLRHFMRDIEASNQFIVINAVELQSVTDTTAVSVTPEGEAVPASRATLVSLRLDMATYFRRVASEEQAPLQETETP
jgi:Tfp pilus assembly protein PilO